MNEFKLNISQLLDIVKTQFDSSIWIYKYLLEAEVKSIKKIRNYYYIDLVEIENWKILNSIRSNIFNWYVMTSFLDEVEIDNIQDLVWKKLLLSIQPSFHKIYNFSINIQKIHSDFFIGTLEKQKKENIQKLQNLWIFWNNKLKDIWQPTFNLAIVTWKTSEWFRDFKTILDESGYKYNIDIFNSLVHWEKASLEVVNQLDIIQSKIENWKKYNLVAIIRWWGWSEWMNWSNDFELCKKVCNFKIPVMSAVWHTVDKSILDMVSFYDCKTPSEASQILIDICSDYEYNIKIKFDSITSKISNFNNKYKNDISYLSKNLPLKFSNKITIYIQKLEKQNYNINTKISTIFNKYKYNLNYIYSELPLKFSRKKNNYINKLETINHKINNKSKYILSSLFNRLELIINNIRLNDPNKILEKWYNLIYDKEWKVVKEYSIWKEYLMKTKSYEYMIWVKTKNKFNS